MEDIEIRQDDFSIRPVRPQKKPERSYDGIWRGLCLRGEERQRVKLPPLASVSMVFYDPRNSDKVIIFS